MLEELISRCKHGEREAQKKLYHQFAERIFASCLKYTSSYEDAQDVLQETFITAFAKIKQYKGEGNFEGWLRRISINKALAQQRKTKVYTLNNEQGLAEKAVENNRDSMSLDLLLRFIRELSDRYRMVFTLYVLEDHTHAEISKMLGISVGTSKSNLARARAILAEKVEKHKSHENVRNVNG